MRFFSNKSMIVPVSLFITLVVLDGYISYTAIQLNLAYELNPLYYRFGDFFWLIKSACSLFVVFIAMRMYNQHPFLTLRAMYACSAIMSLVVVWNIIQITLFT